jgi:adenylate cyclase
MPTRPFAASSDLLDSWKEIAVYLQRDVRTVMRWEQSRGLPVHRLPGGSAVHASKSELEAWRKSGIHLLTNHEAAERLPPATARLPSVAVLPFVNLTDAKESEYFSEGLADEIITALTRVSGLHVTARTSSFAFRGQEQDVREIGRRLGVEFLLEGSVQRADNRTRVSAQLVSASDGFHLWSDHYDRELQDVFAVEDEIAGAIVAALKVKIGPEPSPRKRTSHVEAYRAWMKGRHYRFGARTLSEIIEAGRCFSRAVALDPDFAAAHHEVGQHLLHLAIYGLAPASEARVQGRSEVARALKLDERLGEAHATMGQFRALFDFDWSGAEAAFTNAMACEPGSALILRRHAGAVLSPLRRLDQAEADARQALELDPLCPESHFLIALILFFRREYERAEASIATTIELGGANPFVQWIRGVIAAIQGRSEEAVANCEGAIRLYGRAPMLCAGLGMIYGFAGRTAEARAVLSQLETAAGGAYISPIYRAWVHLGLGEFDDAFEWLDRAIEVRDPHILHLPVKPVYDRLRGDARFDRLLRKMRLPAATSA